MLLSNMIIGRYINLRSVEEEDTEFILTIRVDERLNKYLNKVENDPIKQKIWIKDQVNRPGDYYFIVLSKELEQLGTISLYNMSGGEAEFGRWVSIANSIQNLESVILLHDFGFNQLNLDRIYSRTVIDNKKVINFHKRFGASYVKIYHDTKLTSFVLVEYEIFKKDYPAIREENIMLINKFLDKGGK